MKGTEFGSEMRETQTLRKTFREIQITENNTQHLASRNNSPLCLKGCCEY